MTSLRRPDRPRGFTMIEVLTVLMVMSVVVRIGIPNYQSVLLKAEAARAVADFEAIRYAAIAYENDLHSWPEDAAPGQVPPGLVDYLPEGFTFIRPIYRLDWENWSLSSGLTSSPDTRGFVALSIVTDNEYLGAYLEGLLGSNATHFLLGNTYTFVVDSY